MGGGVYIASRHNLALHTIYQTRCDRIVKLGQTDLVNLVTVRIFGGTEMQLGGTDMQLGRTNMVRVRA